MAAWPESSGCSQLQGGSGNSVLRCFPALGLLWTLDASVPLGAQAGLGKAWLNRGQVAWLGLGYLGWKWL